MTDTETALNDRARQRLEDLRFAGALTQVDANARSLRLIETRHGSGHGHETITLTLLIDDQERVIDLRYRSPATGTDLLTWELMAEWCVGRHLSELAHLTPARLTRLLDEWGYGFPASLEGAGAADRPYAVLVKAAAPAGDDAAHPAAAGGAAALPWQEVGLFEKVRRTETVLDEEIRPVLASDGGGMELIDLRDDAGVAVLVVAYQGACGSCSAALGGTLQFIEETLTQRLGTTVRLEVQGMEADDGFFDPLSQGW